MRYKYIDEKGEHLHTLDGKPLIGTSTATKVISKNLTWWSAELSAVECLEAGEKIPNIREEYIAAKALGKVGIDELQKKYPLFRKARFAHMKDRDKKADAGTDMHAELESYVKDCIVANKVLAHKTTGDEPKFLYDFVEWAQANIKKFLWSEGHCYSEKLWTGGIGDAGMEMKDGKVLVGDFKSSKEAFPDQFIQCAGYGIEMKESGVLTKDGEKMLDVPKIDGYVVFPFGAPTFEPTFRYNVEEQENAFRAAVTLHKIINN